MKFSESDSSDKVEVTDYCTGIKLMDITQDAKEKQWTGNSDIGDDESDIPRSTNENDDFLVTLDSNGRLKMINSTGGDDTLSLVSVDPDTIDCGSNAQALRLNQVESIPACDEALELKNKRVKENNGIALLDCAKEQLMEILIDTPASERFFQNGPLSRKY